jgi:hypothetical protein
MSPFTTTQHSDVQPAEIEVRCGFLKNCVFGVCAWLIMLLLLSLIGFPVGAVALTAEGIAILIVTVLIWGLMLRTLLTVRVSSDGLRQRLFLFKENFLPWQTIQVVRANPFVLILHGHAFLQVIFLPRMWLQRRPARFAEFVLHHAPIGSAIRRAVGAPE